MAVESGNSPTSGDWNKKKEVIVTVYHVDVEDTITRVDNKKGKKGKKSKSQSQDGGAVPSQTRKPNTFHSQPLTNTNNRHRKPFRKHGADRKAEILQWYQEMNKQSRAASINTSTQKNSRSSAQVPIVSKSQETEVRKARDVYSSLKNGKKPPTARDQNDIIEIAARPDKSFVQCRKKNESTNKTNIAKALPKLSNGDLNNLNGGRQIPAKLNKGATNKCKERWTVIQSSLCGLSSNAAISPQKILPKNKNERKWHSKIVSEIGRVRRICECS